MVKKAPKLPKKVRQPRRMTIMPLKLTVYEKRIIYNLVAMAQAHIKGKVYPGLKIVPDVPNMTEAEMEASDIYDDFNNNYAAVKKSLLTLSKKQFPPYEDDEIWQAVPIIIAPKIEKKSGKIGFYVEQKTWEYLLTFGKAYTSYELKAAMTLKSVYSMQMYEYCSEQRKAQKVGGFEVGIDALRKMFCLEDKYPNTSDFLKYTLGIAKKELDSCSPWSFEWAVPIDGKSGRGNKIEKIWIKPIEQPQFADPELRKLMSARPESSGTDNENKKMEEIKTWLMNELKWTEKSFESAKPFLQEASKHLDLYTFLPKVYESWKKVKDIKPNMPGYIINALKGEIEQRKKSANPTAKQLDLFTEEGRELKRAQDRDAAIAERNAAYDQMKKNATKPDDYIRNKGYDPKVVKMSQVMNPNWVKDNPPTHPEWIGKFN